MGAFSFAQTLPWRHVLACGCIVIICGCTTPAATTTQSAGLGARPAADLARDTGRKPFAVLDFLGIREGMTVLDVIAASGYYTEALAHVVGPEGLVYAQNPALVLRFRGAVNDIALSKRLAGNRLPNVQRVDREFNDLGLRPASIDAAVTALNLHDVYNRDEEAAANMLRVIKELLKPGGVLGIIDHDSNPGADHTALHRMPKAAAVELAQAAGFTVEVSELLANPDDDRTQSPFAEGVRGNTDRFLLKLTKPVD